ncbi:MAG: hypothetical protein M1501_00675 [Candidatus Omnitrophica bacterium]|nr:hypothetical protein [Candidatus Omnitrophota bacterium]
MNIKFGRLYQTENGFRGMLGGVPVLAKKQEDRLIILLDTQKVKEISGKEFISYPLFYFIPPASIYKDKIRRDILDVKINGSLKKIPDLVELLITTYHGNPLLSETDLLIPCPHSADNKIELTRLLCISMGEKIEKPALLNTLQRTRDFEFPQVELSPKERLENVKGAFKIINGDGLRGKICLLVDDIITTGATANECTNLLLSAGAKKVYLITLAQPLKKSYFT